jgi:hypothetical protein
MDDKLRAFVEAGMSRFGRAQLTVVTFAKHIEEILSEILRSRDRSDWGPFLPNVPTKVRSTNYGKEYPLRNARIEGTIDGKPARVTIAVNWFQSETDYPFYGADVTVEESVVDGLESFGWNDPVTVGPAGPILVPDPADFDLHRDFSRLLDELVRFMGHRLQRGSETT